MEKPLDPLVEAAVRPLSDNAEHRLTAISILSETAIPDHPDFGSYEIRLAAQKRKETKAILGIGN